MKQINLCSQSAAAKDAAVHKNTKTNTRKRVNRVAIYIYKYLYACLCVCVNLFEFADEQSLQQTIKYAQRKI